MWFSSAILSKNGFQFIFSSFVYPFFLHPGFVKGPLGQPLPPQSFSLFRFPLPLCSKNAKCHTYPQLCSCWPQPVPVKGCNGLVDSTCYMYMYMSNNSTRHCSVYSVLIFMIIIPMWIHCSSNIIYFSIINVCTLINFFVCYDFVL